MMTNVKTGQEDVFQNAGKAMAKAQEQTTKDQTQGAVAVAKAFGSVNEATDGIASAQAGLFAMGKIGPEMISNMQNANEKQGNAADKTADQTAALYAQTKQYQVEMETIVNKHLPKYAELLKEVNEALQGNFMKFIKGATDDDGFFSLFTKKAKQEPLKPAPYAHLAPQVPVKQGYDAGEKIKEIMLPPKKYNRGGKLGTGGIGIAGENGPELISGPASVFSTASTANLLEALNALKLLSGSLTGEDGIAKSVASSESLKTLISSSLKGFEGFDYNQLQSELSKRPEMNSRSAAMSALDDDRPNSSVSGLTEQMGELVRLMKQNVDQTTRVAMNTN
jgi:hypothetical protein